jgi:hypothetical protein
VRNTQFRGSASQIVGEWLHDPKLVCATSPVYQLSVAINTTIRCKSFTRCFASASADNIHWGTS